MFPMLSYQVRVRFKEVRKASGIAYILLELMQQSVMRHEKITDVLKRFGIPEELHGLFGDELVRLTENGIVNADVTITMLQQPKYFREMTMDLFSLTEKGKMMFSEGAIPTGLEKEKLTNVFYHPESRSYETYTTRSYAKLETSFLGGYFLKRVQYDVSGMEDYLKSVKSSIHLKQEEMSIGIKYEEPEELAAKVEDNLTIEITSEDASFIFGTSDEQAFFNRYYSGSLMTACMLAKDKYKFKQPVPTADIASCRIDNLYTPEDTLKQVSRPCKMFLNRGRMGFVRADNVLTFDGAGTFLDLLDDNAEFALFDLSGCRYYSPLNLRMPCGFGDTCEMQLLVETKAEHDEYIRVLHSLLDWVYDVDYTPEIGRMVLYIAQEEKSPEYLVGYASHQIGKKQRPEDRITLLLEVNRVFSGEPAWKVEFDQLADEQFSAYLQSMKLENILFGYTALKPLAGAMGMPEVAFAARLADAFAETEDPELVYQALSGVGFTESSILPAVNVVVPLADKVLERTRIEGGSKMADRFIRLSSNLWKLCDMLGVDDPAAYTLREDYNADDFFNAYATFISAKKETEPYRTYAKEQYAELDRYAAVFEPVHEVLAAERTAAAKPDTVTVKFIDEQIARGRYSTAVSSMLIKAQYELWNRLPELHKLDAKEVIDGAKRNGCISAQQADMLHRLRMCRNGFQHPETQQIPCDKATLESWRDLVFSLKGGSK